MAVMRALPCLSNQKFAIHEIIVLTLNLGRNGSAPRFKNSARVVAEKVPELLEPKFSMSFCANSMMMNLLRVNRIN